MQVPTATLSKFQMQASIQLVTIAIITCNRAWGLSKLLRELMLLRMPDFPSAKLNILVVENGHRQRSTLSLVEHYRHAGLRIDYFHEPQQGISYARNTALRHALKHSDYIAFIDDDEWPTPIWINELLKCAVEFQAPVVCGPVLPVLPSSAPRWARQGGFFNRQRYTTGTPISYGATNNTLILSAALRRSGLSFDPRFALTGGEDTLFFLKLTEQTNRAVVWCDTATAYETIEPDRMSVRWLFRRAMRVGANMPHYDSAMGKGRLCRLRWALQGGAHVLLALPRSAWAYLLRSDVRRVESLRELGLGLGMLLGAWGGSIQEYTERHV